METKKAVLTKSSLQKIKLIAGVSEECFLERLFRVKSGTGTCLYGAEIRDFPDDFCLPIRKIDKFIKMYDSLVAGNDMPEITYTKQEKEIGLGVKEVYEVVLKGNKKMYRFWTASTPNMDKTAEKDKNKRFRATEASLTFKLAHDQIKDILGAANFIGAKVVRFSAAADGKIVTVRVFDKDIDEQANFFLEIDADVKNTGLNEFDLAIANLERLDTKQTYEVTMCGGGCFFECAAESFFFVFGRHGKE